VKVVMMGEEGEGKWKWREGAENKKIKTAKMTE
jgi:hypothetical protein